MMMIEMMTMKMAMTGNKKIIASYIKNDDVYFRPITEYISWWMVMNDVDEILKLFFFFWGCVCIDIYMHLFWDKSTNSMTSILWQQLTTVVINMSMHLYKIRAYTPTFKTKKRKQNKRNTKCMQYKLQRNTNLTIITFLSEREKALLPSKHKHNITQNCVFIYFYMDLLCLCIAS